MGSVLQFAAFFCICCLIQTVVTHSNQEENSRLNKKLTNSESPEERDFYFSEEKSNDDNVKNERAISQSAWSKEKEEQILPVENKTGTQSDGEFGIKKFLSYLLGVVQELKKEIFGIKEMTLLKNTTEWKNSRDNSEDKSKQSELGETSDASKSIDSVANTDLKNKNSQTKSSYITKHYQKKGNKFIDDDMENSSDMSDDSSHIPNEGAKTKEASKSENTHNFRCMKIKRKADEYSFKAEKTTIIPTSQAQAGWESVKEFNESNENEKRGYFKESNTKSTITEQNRSKASINGIKKDSTLLQTSKTENVIKKNNTDSINNLYEQNEPTEEPLKSDDYTTAASPQNRIGDQEPSKKSNQDKTVVHSSTGRNSKTRDTSDFNIQSSVPVQTTMLPSMSAKDAIYSENETYASKMSTENPTYQKQQEQITSPKPEDQIQEQNNAKSIKNSDEINEHTTVSLQSHKTAPEIPNHKKRTDAYTFDSEVNGNPNEFEDKVSMVIFTHTTIAYNEHELNSKINEQNTSDNFYIGNTIAPTTTVNIMNTDNMNKNAPDNLNDNKRTTENEDSEKPSSVKKDENSSETGKDNDTEQTKIQEVKDDSKQEKSFKNIKLKDTNAENNNEEEDDDLTTSETTKDLQYQYSNREFQNHDVEGSDKLLEVLKNNKTINKSVEFQDNSAEYEYEERDNEDFDIYDELDDTQEFNQESDLNKNNAGQEDDEINQSNTGTILTNESEIYQRYVMEEKSQGPYDTFLEYFYKHSNNPYFQSLKNQSTNLYDEM